MTAKQIEDVLVVDVNLFLLANNVSTLHFVLLRQVMEEVSVVAIQRVDLREVEITF